MTADSSTTVVTHSGEGGGINSPSRRRSLPSPWAQVVRGGGESEAVVSPRVSEQHVVVADQLAVFEPPEGSDGGGMKSAWNKPSANGVVESSNAPVMGAALWPALSESTRSVAKSLSPLEQSAKPDGLVTVFQAPVISQTQQRPARPNSNNHFNTTNNHHNRQRPIRRGGNTGGTSTGYSRPQPPIPPPLPPPFPFSDMTYTNFVPVVLDSQQPLLKNNNWVPRPMGVVHDHSSNRTQSRRNNSGPRPRGESGIHSNGYGGRRDHHGPRSPARRDVHVPQAIVPPPPPPLPRGYFRPGPPFSQPIRTYGPPMGYEMAAPFYYVHTLPPEPYRNAPLISQVTPPPTDPPLHVQITNQIEFYFSDENLATDNFLKSNMDEEGWVPISLIAGFRRVQKLTTDIQMILNSLRDSRSVEFQGDKLRRRNEWRKWVRTSENSTSQSPCGTTNTLTEQSPLPKLTTNEHTISDEQCLTSH